MILLLYNLDTAGRRSRGGVVVVLVGDGGKISVHDLKQMEEITEGAGHWTGNRKVV